MERVFVSYRDPHTKRTLEVYQGIPAYIREFEADEDEMTRYIIGTMSGKDAPKTPRAWGQIAKGIYFSRVTAEMRQKARDQILDATADDIRALAPIIEAVLSDDQICVIGSETAMQKNEDLFDKVQPLFS